MYIDTHILSLVQQWDEIPPTSTNLLAGCNWSPERPALRPWIADPKKKRWIPKMLGGDGEPLFGQNPTFSTYGSWHVMTCHDPKITNSDCKSENQSNTGFTQGDVWRHLHCLGHGAMGHKVEEMQMWELDSAEEAPYLPWFLLNNHVLSILLSLLSSFWKQNQIDSPTQYRKRNTFLESKGTCSQKDAITKKKHVGRSPPPE